MSGYLPTTGALATAFVLIFSMVAAPVAGAGSTTEWISLSPGDASTQTREARVRVESSTANQLEMRLDLPGVSLDPVVLPDGTDAVRVTAPDASIPEVGLPSVPAFGRWILIPNGTHLEIEVEPGPPVVIHDVVVAPAQPARGQSLDAPEPPFRRNAAVYANDAASPGVFARTEEVKIMRGQPCTVLWLYPVHYNPIQKTLTVYPNLRVTVHFSGEIAPLPTGLSDPGFETAQRGLAINAEAVLDAQKAAEASAAAAHHDAAAAPEQQFGWDYVIFSRLEFAAAGELLADWKRKIGFKPFHLWYSGTPSAIDLRAMLQGWYDTNDIRPRYVLIIGDADDIPCFYETEHPYENLGAQGTQGHIGSDIYYGLLDGFDMLADVSVGRMPVDSEAQALAWVERIIAYEMDPPVVTNFYDTAAVAAYFQDTIYVDGHEDNRFVQTAEDIVKFLSEFAYGVQKTAIRIYETESSVTPTNWSTGQHQQLSQFGGGPAGNPGDPIPSYLAKPGFPWTGSATDITGAIETGGGSGSFLVVHRDHGSRQSWSHPSYTPLDIANLDITFGESPVVWSINCQTGWFDNETDFPYIVPTPGAATADDEESFVEFFANYCHQGGPVGLIGATRVTDTIYNDRLAWGFMDAIWTWFVTTPFEVAPNYRMGDVLNFGKGYMMNHVPDDDWRQTHLESYHWFGDPAMEIRTEHPDWLTADHPQMWPHQGVAHDLVVHVDNSAGPVEGARVTISHPDETFEHWTAWTDADGNASFPGLVINAAGRYDVVATASNHVPWLGSMVSAGSDLIFYDGFESGGTQAWSASLP
ncbi:MAG: C25 family cysteine peptidase [Thermoanaerobaculales bacterium]|jgi:hypothetical protein|nr:C25 family cysteine peptidase [Thermoanaerobaculales bacterium]